MKFRTVNTASIRPAPSIFWPCSFDLVIDFITNIELGPWANAGDMREHPEKYLSQKSATVAENGETTAKFIDCRIFLQQSHFSETVSLFCDKLSHFPATVCMDKL